AQTLERQHSNATLWLLTAGAAQHLADQASPGAPGDASLWGYGRTMMNEAAQFSVRLLDLPGSMPDGAVLDALERELRWPDAEQEAAITHQGRRYTPRLHTVPPPAAPAATAAESSHVRLGFEFPGQLRNLRWEASPAGELASDELEIEVHATGLNFRDVMY